MESVVFVFPWHNENQELNSGVIWVEAKGIFVRCCQLIFKGQLGQSFGISTKQMDICKIINISKIKNITYQYVSLNRPRYKRRVFLALPGLNTFYEFHAQPDELSIIDRP